MKKYKKYTLALTGLAVILLAIVANQYAKDNPDDGYAAKYRPYINFISQTFNNPDLQYRYTMSLYDESGHKGVDSINGVLCKHNGDFIDSNSTGISLLKGDIFCSIDKINHNATICRLSVMENTLGIKKEDLNNMLFSISDSSIKKLGNLSLQASGDEMTLTCVMNNSPDGMKRFVFVSDKAMQHLKKINMAVRDDNSATFTKMLTLSAFSNDANATINPERYFTIQGKKVMLSKTYKDYKLKTAI